MSVLSPSEIQSLIDVIEGAIGDENGDIDAAYDALRELATAAEEAMGDVQALRDAIYAASQL